MFPFPFKVGTINFYFIRRWDAQRNKREKIACVYSMEDNTHCVRRSKFVFFCVCRIRFLYILQYEKEKPKHEQILMSLRQWICLYFDTIECEVCWTVLPTSSRLLRTVTECVNCTNLHWIDMRRTELTCIWNRTLSNWWMKTFTFTIALACKLLSIEKLLCICFLIFNEWDTRLGLLHSKCPKYWIEIDVIRPYQQFFFSHVNAPLILPAAVIHETMIVCIGL